MSCIKEAPPSHIFHSNVKFLHLSIHSLKKIIKYKKQRKKIEWFQIYWKTQWILIWNIHYSKILKKKKRKIIFKKIKNYLNKINEHLKIQQILKILFVLFFWCAYYYQFCFQTLKNRKKKVAKWQLALCNG